MPWTIRRNVTAVAVTSAVSNDERIIAWTRTADDARTIAYALNQAEAAVDAAPSEALAEAIQVIRELKRFIPFDKPEFGPQPSWINETRQRAEKFLQVNCAHDWDKTKLLQSYPPRVACNTCGTTKAIEEIA